MVIRLPNVLRVEKINIFLFAARRIYPITTKYYKCHYALIDFADDKIFHGRGKLGSPVHVC